MQNIILASQSPRRKQLLEWANIQFEVVIADTDERYSNDLSLEQIPVFIAKNKALAVKEKVDTNSIVIAADTIVAINNKILGKPKDKVEAIDFLQQLSGNIHQVITGVVIIKNDKQIDFFDVTKVEFHQLTLEQISFYIDNYKPYDKAGAYGIQEWMGVVGIKKIEGDFYNVMGLPVSRVVQEFEKMK